MSDVVIDPAEVRESLARLGKTEDEIAESLRARGIKAVAPGFSARTCPLAVYLRKEFPGAGYVSMTGAYTRVGDSPVTTPSILLDSLPQIARFVSVYDGGGYPDLRAA